MILLNPIFVSKLNGVYNSEAAENLTELKKAMKNIIVKETKGDSLPAFAETKIPNHDPKVEVSTQTGGSVWISKKAKYIPAGLKKKKQPSTFAL
jgi:hypothetical protein